MSRLLLDTHALIWFTMGDRDHMPERVEQRITAAGVEPVVSMASLWEIAIKAGIGKLVYPPIGFSGLPERLADQGFAIAPIAYPEIRALKDLPDHHRDPFDRLLVAQATVGGMRILSCDEKFDAYGVERVWK